MTGRSTWAAMVLGLALVGAPGCKKSQPPAPPSVDLSRAPAAAEVKVTEVQLGTAVGVDKRIAQPKTAFSTKDTIFASVATEGTANAAEIAAKWTFQDGQVVNESRRSIAPSGKEVTEFSIQKPDGWPAGSYKVEISLNGKPADSKTFTVQ
jgi:hypothetical protein